MSPQACSGPQASAPGALGSGQWVPEWAVPLGSYLPLPWPHLPSPQPCREDTDTQERGLVSPHISLALRTQRPVLCPQEGES